MNTGIQAGNTAETLTPVPVEEAVDAAKAAHEARKEQNVAAEQAKEDAQSAAPSAADLDAVAAEADAKVATTPFEVDETVAAPAAPEFVPRAEFDDLVARVNKFNIGAPRRI